MHFTSNFKQALFLLVLVVLTACTDKQPRNVFEQGYVPKNIDNPALFLQLKEMMLAEGGPFIKVNYTRPNKDKTHTKSIFVRWEEPIRYYLNGLDAYPQLEQAFEDNMKEIAAITGLDIARHNGIYNDGLNTLSGSPDGLKTNVAVFFSKNLKKTFNDERVKVILKAYKIQASKAMKNYYDKVTPEDKFYTSTKYGMNTKGLSFVFHISTLIKNESEKNRIKNYKHLIVSIGFNSLLDNAISNSNYVLSITNTDAYKKEIFKMTDFDKQYLKAIYSNKVKTGDTIETVLTKVYSDLKSTQFEKVATHGQ